MGNKKYRVVIANSGKLDVKAKKRYILEQFKYREYAENYSQNIKKAAKELGIYPRKHEMTGFRYRGYDIYIMPQDNQLLFYTINEEKHIVTVLRVLQDGMDWQNIIKRWLSKHS